MAVLQVSNAPSRELYEQVARHLRIDEDRPAGLIAHAAAELPDGRVQIVEIYESMDDLEAFGRNRIFPAFAAAGVPQELIEANRPTPYVAFDTVLPQHSV